MKIDVRKRFYQIKLLKTELAAVLAAASFVVTVVLTLFAAQYFIEAPNGSFIGKKTLEMASQNIPPDVIKAIKNGAYPFLTDASQSAEASLANQNAQELHIPILMYHYVEYVKDRGDTTRILLDILPKTLEAQITTLKDAGYTFLMARDLGEILAGKKEVPPKPIVLTFDDGYADFYTDVYPILKRQGVKATVYVVSGFLNKPNYLRSQDVTDILTSGLVELGDHTVHHLALRGKKLEDVTREIAQSKVALEKEFGQRVVSFCYPYGSFDVQAVTVAGSVGYTTATTTTLGTGMNYSKRLLLPRLRPGSKVGKALLDWLAQEGKR